VKHTPPGAFVSLRESGREIQFEANQAQEAPPPPRLIIRTLGLNGNLLNKKRQAQLFASPCNGTQRERERQTVINI
jgi:hypothetical protein